MISRHSRLLLCAGLFAAVLPLHACTATSGIDMAAELEAVAADPELPEQVAILPSLANAAAAPDRAAASGFVPVGYAGGTPSGPKAAAFIEGGFPIRKVAARSPELDRLIAHYAGVHQIPESLLRRVVNRESTFNPAARNGPYWGLMQILPATARTMGYSGSPQGLLDAETNLRYAGKYLKGAYMVADGNHDRAVQLYARGYYYDAKRKGLLEATGLR